jgi:mannosyltransferase OCH1-like enzyme
VNTNLSINKFYSINTILCFLPELQYEFFDNERIVKYLHGTRPELIYFFDKLIPGAYKADLFRAIYLYFNGGIYFDCKNILYTPIYFILSKKRCLCEDLIDNIYNGNMFFPQPYDNDLKKYILHMLKNIKEESYASGPLDITGPGLLKKYINDTIYVKNVYSNDEWKENWNKFTESGEWKNSYIIDIATKRIILKTSYYTYYDDITEHENNYMYLYNTKQVYSTDTMVEDFVGEETCLDM